MGRITKWGGHHGWVLLAPLALLRWRRLTGVEALIKGTFLPTVTIQLIRTGEMNQLFMEYELKNARVINVSVSGRSFEGQFVPVEEVHLIYQEIKWSYTEIDLMGKTKGKTEAAWKVEQN